MLQKLLDHIVIKKICHSKYIRFLLFNAKWRLHYFIWILPYRCTCCLLESLSRIVVVQVPCNCLIPGKLLDIGSCLLTLYYSLSLSEKPREEEKRQRLNRKKWFCSQKYIRLRCSLQYQNVDFFVYLGWSDTLLLCTVGL